MMTPPASTKTSSTRSDGRDEGASTALHIENLRVRYLGRRGAPPRIAVDGISLTIPAGQRVAVLGPNGSGKTTIFRAICDLQQTDEGTIEIFGARHRIERLRHLGVVFQTQSLDPHLTVRENLCDQALIFGIDRAIVTDRVDRALREADLIDRADDRVKHLSGGLARRVDLCRAMLSEPRLLLLDEPTAGLDPAARESFLATLDEAAQARGLTIVMSTHLIDEADRQDRVIFLHEGGVRADDAPPALRRRLGSALMTVLDSRWEPPVDERAAWHRAAGLWRRAVDDEKAAALGKLGAIVEQLMNDRVPFTFAPPTLADVFAHVTGASLESSVEAPPTIEESG